MKIKKWHIAGTVFTIVLGSILHFVYEWSGFHPFFGLIGSVNESVWEHLKLIFWPFLVSMIAEMWAYGKSTSGFFCAKAQGVICAMLFVVVSFYTYTAVLGKNLAAIDALIFITGVVVEYFVSYRHITCSYNAPKKADFWGLAFFFVFAVMFCIYSFNPPQIGIFCP